jgi:hypothetical protein
MSILDTKVMQPGSANLPKKYRYEPTLRELIRNYYSNEVIPKEKRRSLANFYIREIDRAELELKEEWANNQPASDYP